MAPRLTEADRLPAVEAVHLETGLVDAAVVVVRPGADGRRLVVAYVVPAPHVPFSAPDLQAAASRMLAPGQQPDLYVHVRSIPLTCAGDVDVEALLDLEVLDEDVRRRWEEHLRAEHGSEVAVVLEDATGEPRALHLSDLLPGWSGGLGSASAEATTAAGARRDDRTGRRPALVDGGPLEMTADAPRTLGASLIATAARRGHRRIVLAQPDGSEVVLTYAALLESARRILTGLRRAGLAPGDSAILQLPRLDDHLPAFWACLLGGITPLTIAVPASYDPDNAVVRKLANAWRLLGGPVVLASRTLVEPLRGLTRSAGLHALTVIPVDDLRASAPAQDFHAAVPDDVAFFQLSSGSTGVSKCIQITHRGVVAHVHASQQHLGLSPDDVTLNWLPMDHVVPLLMYHVKDVYLGCEQVHVPTDVVLGNPLAWLDCLERYRVTYTWSPNFAYKMLADALAASQGRRWDLTCVKGFLNGGEQVTLPVVERFLELIAPHGVPRSALQRAWGMAETCTIVTCDDRFAPGLNVQRLAKSSLQSIVRSAAPDEPAVTVIDCGTVVRGLQVRIADRENAVLPEGAVGRVQVRGPVVTPGYLNNPEANEALVGDGWFNTGDLGLLREGRLSITGREKELIIVNGANYYCYEIEDAAGDLPGVLPTCIAACGVDDPAAGTEALALFFVHDEAARADLLEVVKAIRSRVAARIGLSPAIVVPVARDEFPKTTSGKIQRRQLKQSLLDGRFEERLKTLDLRLENANTLPDWFYRAIWRRKRLPAATTARRGAQVVFLDRHGLGARLRAGLAAEGLPCVTVAAGADFRRRDPHSYEIDPAEDAHYSRLFQSVMDDGTPISDVFHLWTCGACPDPVSSSAIDEALSAGVYSVFRIAGALAAAGNEHPVRFTVVSSHAARAIDGDRVVPERAAVAGFLKSVAAEQTGLSCQHIDVDPDALDAAANAIVRERRSPVCDTEVSYRSGERLVRRLERLSLTEAPRAQAPFVRNGVYLLAGGLGGVGVELATHLLQAHQARLLLVGRSPLDGASDRAQARLAAFTALRALPGEVRYETVDITDPRRLAEVVADAEREWQQPLDGVIHLAGDFVERTLAQETAESFALTLRPKVHGTRVLDALLEERPGARLVTFSSVNGFFGGYGAAAYSTANAFLDAFADARGSQPGARVRCLAWTLWDETGMSRGHVMKAAAHASGYRAISRTQGLHSLLAVLHREVAHVLIGLSADGRIVRRLVEGADPRARQLTAYHAHDLRGASPGVLHQEALTDRFGRSTSCRRRRADSVPAAGDGSVAVRALPRTELERIVAGVWQEVLKQDAFGIHDNFFDLNGTSLLAGQIAGRLRERLSTDVEITRVFQFPTIAAQAAFLAGDAATSMSIRGERRGAARREGMRRLRRAAR